MSGANDSFRSSVVMAAAAVALMVSCTTSGGGPVGTGDCAGLEGAAAVACQSYCASCTPDSRGECDQLRDDYHAASGEVAFPCDCGAVDIVQPPSAEPVTISEVPLPEHIFGLNETVRFMHDGEHFVFPFRSSTLGGVDSAPQLGLMKPDGSGFQCLTCNLPEPVGVMRPSPFADGRRVLIQANETDEGQHDGAILECEPSLLECTTAVLVPIRAPETPGSTVFQNREYRLGPDDVHVLWNQVRADIGLSVVMGALVRRGTDGNETDPLRYDIDGARMLVGADFVTQQDGVLSLPSRVTNLSQNIEGRGFAEGGRSVLYVSTEDSMNYDLFKIDLATGDVTRITRDIEYEDPIEASPDGKWYVVMSTRGVSPPRLSSFAQIVRPPLADRGMGLPAAYNRNHTVTRRRYLQPWLLDEHGDRGDYRGQQLNEGVEAEYNGRADPSWHPDGTKVLFWEAGDPDVFGGDEVEFWEGRIRLATLTSRSPSPAPEISVPEPTWATLLSELETPDVMVEGTLAGRVFGHAAVVYTASSSSNAFLGLDYSIEYFNYSDDGRTVLNGTEMGMSHLASGPGPWQVDLTVSGCVDGQLDADAMLDGRGPGNGTITSELDGETFVGPPDP